MPIFEYACKACGHRFEELVTGSERPACPKCASRQLDKLLSVFAVNSATGGSTGSASGGFGPGACGTCGDPRGPGSCGLN